MVRAIQELVVFVMEHGVRTNIYLSKPQKAALEKIAKKKGIFVAELGRRIMDKELDRQRQKG